MCSSCVKMLNVKRESPTSLFMKKIAVNPCKRVRSNLLT